MKCPCGKPGYLDMARCRECCQKEILDSVRDEEQHRAKADLLARESMDRLLMKKANVARPMHYTVGHEWKTRLDRTRLKAIRLAEGR